MAEPSVHYHNSIRHLDIVKVEVSINISKQVVQPCHTHNVLMGLDGTLLGDVLDAKQSVIYSKLRSLAHLG